jgi:hypothetical protein
LRFSTVAITLDCQSAGIANYAQGNGFEVCQTYCDEAKSGLEIGEDEDCLNCSRMSLGQASGLGRPHLALQKQMFKKLLRLDR